MPPPEPCLDRWLIVHALRDRENWDTSYPVHASVVHTARLVFNKNKIESDLPFQSFLRRLPKLVTISLVYLPFSEPYMVFFQALSGGL